MEVKMAKTGWIKVKSVVILKTPFFTLYRRDFCRPDGSLIKDYYLMEKPESVHIIPIKRDGKVVLLKHYRPGPNKFSLELPAGYIKDNETLEEACQRELIEETGYRAQHFLYVSDFTEDTSRVIGYRCHLFIAYELNKAEKRDFTPETKDIEITEMPLKKAIRKIEKTKKKDLILTAGLLLAQRITQRH